jgi:uncharacterized membrane protein YvbJ
MKCPSCQADDVEGARFCDECGSKLELVCRQCGTANRPGAKFCLKCGHKLIPSQDSAVNRDISFDEKLAKIQKYLPGGLTEKILSQRDRIEGERRQGQRTTGQSNRNLQSM